MTTSTATPNRPTSRKFHNINNGVSTNLILNVPMKSNHGAQNDFPPMHAQDRSINHWDPGPMLSRSKPAVINFIHARFFIDDPMR